MAPGLVATPWPPCSPLALNLVVSSARGGSFLPRRVQRVDHHVTGFPLISFNSFIVADLRFKWLAHSTAVYCTALLQRYRPSLSLHQPTRWHLSVSSHKTLSSKRHIGAGWKRPTAPEVISHDNITLGTSRKHSFGPIWASWGLWRPLEAKPNRQW